VTTAELCKELGRATYHLLAAALASRDWREDSRGRYRAFIGRRHPYAQRRGHGMAWRYRFIAQVIMGRALEEYEHVHHEDHDPGNDTPWNLSVVHASYHGSYHATGIYVAKWDGFRLSEPDPQRGEFELHRDRWLISDRRQRAR